MHKNIGHVRKQVPMIILMALLTVGLAFASGDAEQPDTEAEGRFSFSIMLQDNPNSDVSRVMPIVEEYTDTDIEIVWTESMDEVLPVAMAAGDLPDSIGSWWYRLPYHVSAIRGGVFRDLTDFIADYENLSAVPDQVYTNVTTDGRIYGLPRMRKIARASITYRVDWAENLGIDHPETVEEYYEMLRAFTFDDPDGNGEDDTRGISDRAGNSMMTVGRQYSLMFGAPNGWGVRNDGTFYAAEETEEYVNGLRFAKRIIDEGLTFDDWPVVIDQEMNDRFVTGRAGAQPRHIDQAYNFQGLMPEAKLGMISQLEGPDGEIRTNGERGAGGIILFTSSSFEDDSDLRRALQFFDDLGDPEMSNLFRWGIEGEHWEERDGKAFMIDQEGYSRELEHLRNQMVVLAADINAIPGNLSRIQEWGERLARENEQYAVFDPTVPLISSIAAEKGPQLEQMLEDAKVKFLAGEIDEDGWWEAIQEWRDAGGTELAAEYAELHAAANE